MTNPLAGHTAEQQPPTNAHQHPGTTPVPVFVPDEAASTMSWKGAQVSKALQEAFVAAKTITGFPQVASVIIGDLYWKKETRWSTNDAALLALAGEVLLLARVLSDPGVQRIASLLQGQEAA